MIVSEKKLENACMELQIEASQDQIEREYAEVFKKLQMNAKIDGFRKGKAPLDIIKRKFKENADAEVVESIAKNAYIDALKEKELSPISQPEFKIDSIDISKPFIFTVKFDIAPTVKLGDYKGLSTKENDCKIVDEDIEKEIQSMRERHAAVSKRQEGDKAENGDYVRAETKRIDDIDKEEIDNVKPDNFSLVIGKYINDHSFDKDLIGMKVGDEKEVSKKYPKDFVRKEIAGQKVKYLLKVIEISSLELPDLDDEFAKDLGDYSSLNELNKKLRDDLENFVKEKAKSTTKNELIKKIIESSKFDLPESLIIREMDNTLRRFQNQVGMKDEDFEKFLNKTKENNDKMMKNIREESVSNIKSTLILSEVANVENLKVTEEKFNEFVEDYAKRNNKSFDEMKTILEQPGTKENVESELIINHAADYIYDSATIKKQKAVSLEEFMKLG